MKPRVECELFVPAEGPMTEFDGKGFGLTGAYHEHAAEQPQAWLHIDEPLSRNDEGILDIALIQEREDESEEAMYFELDHTGALLLAMHLLEFAAGGDK